MLCAVSGEPHFPPPHRTDAIVLVHGAWVGEWSWFPILDRLRASGRPVHAVSLAGHGARRHESAPTIDLGTHVADVVGLVETFDLVDVTLVGHSYGGRVITRAWGEIGDRVSAMVYVDAHAPVAPEPLEPEGRAQLAADNDGMLPFYDSYTPTEDLVGDVDWFMDRVALQSYACFEQPWQIELPDALPKTYIHATAGGDSRFAHYADACVGRPGWTRHDLDGPHFVMMSHPDETARLILEAISEAFGARGEGPDCLDPHPKRTVH